MAKAFVPIQRIEPHERPDLFEIMEDLIAKHHDHLTEARIALVWKWGWMEDKDGRLKLGQAKKCSQLDREFRDFDFLILLNAEVVQENKGLSNKQLRALLDHELCHCQVQLDANDGLKLDDRNRVMYRLRGHDVEEFSEIVKRHGVWKTDLEVFAANLIEKAKPELFPRAAATA